MDCNICGEGLGTGFYTNPRNDDRYCNDCINDGEVTLSCDRCDYTFTQEDIAYSEDVDLFLCYLCQEDFLTEQRNTPFNRVNYKPFDPLSKEFISNDQGDIIKSDRTFGVEFELVNRNNKAILDLSNSISDAFGFERDTSIAGDNPIEVVTPILKGKKGEQLIKDVCKDLNERSFETNDSTGLHVHLGNDGFSLNREIKICSVREINNGLNVANNPKANEADRMIISEKVLKMVQKTHRIHDLNSTVEFILERANKMFFDKEALVSRLGLPQDLNLMLTNTSLEVRGEQKTFKYLCAPTKKVYEDKNKERNIRIDKMESILSKYETGNFNLKIPEDALNHLAKELGTSSIEDIHQIRFEASENDLLCSMSKNSNLANLKTLLYLHSAYSDFFYSMLPANRRNNKQCQAINLSLAPKDIERISSREELEALWYKSESLQETNYRKTGTKYDESRYYGLNLHRLFQKDTIELRYHSGSTDSDSILHWIALNQYLLDEIVSGNVAIFSLTGGAGIFDRKEKVDYLMDRFNLPENLRKYVNARIKHFT